MFSKIKIISLITLVLLLATGCATRKDYSPTPSVTSAIVDIPTPSPSTSTEQEEILIFAPENFNLTFYKNIGYFRYFTFDIVSTRQISQAFAEIDIKTPYTFTLGEERVVYEFPSYVLENYLKVDWKERYALHLEHKDIPLDERLDLRNLDEKYKESLANIPILYQYECTIAFDMFKLSLDSNEVFNTINLTIDGKNYTVSTGKILLDYTTSNTYFYGNIRFNSPFQAGRKIIPHPNGTIPVTGLTFTCEKDISIIGFNFLENGVEIADMNIITQYNNQTLSQKYIPGAPLLCKTGSQIHIECKATDANFVGKLRYSTVLHLIINYETDGKQYAACYESGLRTHADPYELYAAAHDNIDFTSYYYDYAGLILVK